MRIPNRSNSVTDGGVCSSRTVYPWLRNVILPSGRSECAQQVQSRGCAYSENGTMALAMSDPLSGNRMRTWEEIGAAKSKSRAAYLSRNFAFRLLSATVLLFEILLLRPAVVCSEPHRVGITAAAASNRRTPRSSTIIGNTTAKLCKESNAFGPVVPIVEQGCPVGDSRDSGSRRILSRFIE